MSVPAFVFALEAEPFVGVGLTGALVGGLIGLLRLYGTGTARIDSAAESRVVALTAELARAEARCEAEIARAARREGEIQGRCDVLSARVKELEDRE